GTRTAPASPSAPSSMRIQQRSSLANGRARSGRLSECRERTTCKFVVMARNFDGTTTIILFVWPAKMARVGVLASVGRSRPAMAVVYPGDFFYTIDALPDGTPPALVRGTSSKFALLEHGVGDDAVVLVDPNPHTATWKFPTVEHVTWKAPDGVSVGGPLELP